MEDGASGLKLIMAGGVRDNQCTHSTGFVCTNDLYGPVRYVFDAGLFITCGSGGGGWRWKSRVFWNVMNQPASKT